MAIRRTENTSCTQLSMTNGLCDNALKDASSWEESGGLVASAMVCQ